MDDAGYPSERRGEMEEDAASYNQVPYDVDEEEEYNEIAQDYPQLMDTYQRAMRRAGADNYNPEYLNWLQDYYDQIEA